MNILKNTNDKHSFLPEGASSNLCPPWYVIVALGGLTWSGTEGRYDAEAERDSVYETLFRSI